MNPRILIVIFLLLIAAGIGFPSANRENSLAERERTILLSPEALAVKSDLAHRLLINAQDIVILEMRAVDWPDSCLGLAGQNETCAHVIIPGFEIVLRAQGKDYRYRINSDGTVVRFVQLLKVL